MARIDRARLEAADFPFVTEIQTRYADLDPNGHVNNAAAAVILQEARGRFQHATGVKELMNRYRYIVAGLAIEFAAEMFFPEPVEVRTGVLHIGRTSFTVGQIAHQRGRTTLYAETTAVLADENGPTPMSDAVRAAYGRFLLS